MQKVGGLTATDDVSLAISLGELHAIIGPNGAGKTTLLNQVAGELHQDAGAILLDGHEIGALSPWKRVGRGLARTFQITPIVAGRNRHGQRQIGGAGPARPQLPLLRRRAARSPVRMRRLRSFSRTSASPRSHRCGWLISRMANASSSNWRWRSPRARRCSCSTSRWLA
ncbi:ATP-binding cassette domain-containing protein [Bradyrhizobium liaoningense]